MDKEVLDQRLGQLCQQAMQEAKAAVAQAPDGAWIAASEWPIRHIFQKLTRDCYQLLMQVRIEEHDAAREAAFLLAFGIPKHQ